MALPFKPRPESVSQAKASNGDAGPADTKPAGLNLTPGHFMRTFLIVILAAIFFTFMMVIDEMLGILDAWNPGHAYYFPPPVGAMTIGWAWTWIVFPAMTACFLLVAWLASRTQVNTN